MKDRNACPELPPAALITSVRAVVADQQHVLVVRGPEGHHILPGGRREEGETLEQTLRREVLEETGWEIDNIAHAQQMSVYELESFLAPLAELDRQQFPADERMFLAAAMQLVRP